MANNKSWAWVTVLVGSLVVVVFTFYAWKTLVVDPWAARDEKRDYSTPGQFGDSFGVLSGVFNALVFVGTLYTIHQARQTNESQTRQLDEQRKSSDHQAAILDQAIRHLGTQAQEQQAATLLAMTGHTITAVDHIVRIDLNAVTAIANVIDFVPEKDATPVLRAGASAVWRSLQRAHGREQLGAEPWHSHILSEDLVMLLDHRRLLSQLLKPLRNELTKRHGWSDDQNLDDEKGGKA